MADVAGRIRAEQGRLDLLVNNVWGGYERLSAGTRQAWEGVDRAAMAAAARRRYHVDVRS